MGGEMSEEERAEEKLNPEGRRPCPVCGQTMIVEVDKQRGVRADSCPEHGVWLDNGELEKIAMAVRGRERRHIRHKIKRAEERAVRKAGLAVLFDALF